MGLGFAAANKWLAAKLADPVLKRRMLLPQAAEEYHELMGLMSEDGCKWVQVGTCDWVEDSGLVKDSAWGGALLLAYSQEQSVMSDVVEAPTSSGGGGHNMGFVVRLHGIEGLVVVRPGAGEPVGADCLRVSTEVTWIIWKPFWGRMGRGKRIRSGRECRIRATTLTSVMIQIWKM